jgi:hypothetical protein
MHLKLSAIKIDRKFEAPRELLAADAAWAYSFTQENVIDVLNRAEAGRNLQPAHV